MWSSESIEWIDIELTSFCNIDCPGCFRQVKRKKVNDILDKDNLTLKQIKKWVTKKNFPNCKLINFCGSIDEPTLHPELLELYIRTRYGYLFFIDPLWHCALPFLR